MTVFKTFWNVVKKYKGTIILYTIILLVFGSINMKAESTSKSFENTKPDVLIINKDKNGKLANNLEKYIAKNSNQIEIEQEEAKIKDALFYREINYAIYIPENYSRDIINGQTPQIDIKSTQDYNASLTELMLKRYLKIQNLYKENTKNEEELIKLINNNLKATSNIEITSKLNTSQLTNASQYFSFASYSIMAVVIFIICLVLASFKEKNIRKRNIVSSMNYKRQNRYLLLASATYAIIVWGVYVILGIILLKDVMLTTRGLVYMLNSFCFTFTSLTIALLISNVVNDKNAVNGIVNVIALGSSFLCGAFVPQEFLPDSVLKLAHILPSYWYISSNELLKEIEVINGKELQPIFINCLVIIAFATFFIIINNILSKYKRKVG